MSSGTGLGDRFAELLAAGDIDNGGVQTGHVMVRAEDGSIRRHIPGCCGFRGT